jgi:hypothetical protein
MSVFARLLGRLPALGGFDATLLACLAALTGAALMLR